MTAKALLLSGGDGTAVLAGSVGERISGTAIGATTATLNVANTVSTITIPPGVWLLYVNFNAYPGVFPPGGTAVSVGFDLLNTTDSVGVLVQDYMQFGTSGAYTSGYNMVGEAVLCGFVPFVASASKNISLRLRCLTVVGVPTGATAVSRAAAVGQGFYAIRIA